MMLTLVIAFKVGGWFPPGGITTVMVKVWVVVLLVTLLSVTATVIVAAPSALVAGANVNVPKLLVLE